MDRLSLFPTQDGSLTFWSETYQQSFHSDSGARVEAEAKFVIPAQIAVKSQTQEHLNILDVCYGLGYNSAAAIAAASQPHSNAHLQIIGLENNLEVPQKAVADRLIDIWSPEIVDILTKVAEDQCFTSSDRQIQLLVGDARQTIQQVPPRWADAIFLDPFSPPHCPQLWTVEFLQLLADRLKPDGYLLTYSAAAAVRTALLSAGLQIGAIAPIGRKSPSTIAAFAPMPLPPISQIEADFLKTRAAIPYRDRHLNATATEILRDRQLEQSQSNLPSGSSLRKTLHSLCRDPSSCPSTLKIKTACHPINI